MILTHKLRVAITKYAYLETLAIVAIVLLAGYMFDNADPLLIKYEVTYIIFIMVTITLFHGISNGLFALVLLSVFMKLFYEVFPISEFLHLLILVLVLGEFHYFWNRKIIQNTAKNTYLKIKLDELSNAFYTLKISHDQLEKNYVFKPMSLRNSIRLIKDAYSNEEDYYTEFLTLLKKSFSVSDAQLCTAIKGKLYDVTDKMSSKPIGVGDPMVDMAILKQSPMYVSSQEVQNNSKYLAAIPAVSNDNVKGMLLIKKMPFLSFNKDTLITISVLIAYFLDELEKWKAIKLEKASSSALSNEFAFELKRLHKLFLDYKVESTVLVIKTDDELLSHLILEMIQKNLRSLDLLSSHRSSDTYVLSVLFPFADEASAQGFFKRLLTLLRLQEDDERIAVSFF
jgi:polysaccharide biosynthesis protein PelD